MAGILAISDLPGIFEHIGFHRFVEHDVVGEVVPESECDGEAFTEASLEIVEQGKANLFVLVGSQCLVADRIVSLDQVCNSRRSCDWLRAYKQHWRAWH